MNRKDKEFPLYDTGVTRPYDNKELNKIFHTNDLEFLTSQPVDVIGRKFNFIPARRGDPPRAETDMPPLKAVFNNTNVGVMSDFPKTMSNWENANMWVDGTYEDAKKAIYKAEDQYQRDVKFAPDVDFNYRFNRMAQEQEVKSNIADYFQERETQRTLENMIFLQEYGLSPGEVDEVMARIKVEGAMQALKDPKRGVVTKKMAFERMIADAVKQKAEAPMRVGDMERREVPKQQSIMETFGAIPREKQGIQRRARSESPESRFRMKQPIKDDLEEEIDAEPSAFDRPMGGAGGPAPKRKYEKRSAVQEALINEFGRIGYTQTTLDKRNRGQLADLAIGLGIKATVAGKQKTKEQLISDILEKKA
jgi:hypothetical protein